MGKGDEGMSMEMEDQRGRWKRMLTCTSGFLALSKDMDLPSPPRLLHPNLMLNLLIYVLSIIEHLQ